MTEPQNADSDATEPSVPAPRKLTPARWLVGAAVGVALAVFAMPWLLRSLRRHQHERRSGDLRRIR